ncbi:MAG: aminotransferase class V-fold PLP-dependent enzyme [Saprospiraceae bacterium]
MKNTRRSFLQKALTAASLFPLSTFAQSTEGQHLIKKLKYQPLTATDETFWRQIQQAYTVSPTLLNLNNGGVSPQPRVVQEAVEHYHRYCNNAPSFYMWRELDRGREPLRQQLAALAGCSAEEVAMVRNTSEAMETVIFGLRLERGDEVVLSKYDYPNIMNAWRQREQRDGIVLKWVELDMPMNDTAEIVARFKSQLTERTKIVNITHVINWSGQVLPVREIADVFKANGVEVMVDAAHSFAHLNYKIADLNCDYWGTSLHKWLCAPFGTGMLYVRKEKIKNLYPLFAAPDPNQDDIRKFEHLGTRSFAIEQAIGQAIDFHNLIGTERKLQRLQFLKKYWTGKIAEIPGIQYFTDLDYQWSGALVAIGMEGIKPVKLSQILERKYRIHVSPRQYEAIQGIRITPHVYTLTEDLDRLANALIEIAQTRKK